MASAQPTVIDNSPSDQGVQTPTAPMEMTDLPINLDAPQETATGVQEEKPENTADSPQAVEGPAPATDKPVSPPSPTIAAVASNSNKPVLGLTLLLTTGARHPYKIDEKYLQSRKVTAVDAQGLFDPCELSGYKLKELIWTDWRSEWEPRPASPSAIRLISMGRLLEDKSMLKDFPLKMDETNIMHMSVKPADLFDDDETHGGKGHRSLRARDAGDGGAGCRCVIL